MRKNEKNGAERGMFFLSFFVASKERTMRYLGMGMEVGAEPGSETQGWGERSGLELTVS